mmetsp:Transcript_30091/g.90097  ORF Transcript_30091/g.90097 Transcript_30091/m.90097 type:complete len:292 (-) Transcript_30091:216-1091(-)
MRMRFCRDKVRRYTAFVAADCGLDLGAVGPCLAAISALPPDLVRHVAYVLAVALHLAEGVFIHVVLLVRLHVTQPDPKVILRHIRFHFPLPLVCVDAGVLQILAMATNRVQGLHPELIRHHQRHDVTPEVIAVSPGLDALHKRAVLHITCLGSISVQAEISERLFLQRAVLFAPRLDGVSNDLGLFALVTRFRCSRCLCCLGRCRRSLAQLLGAVHARFLREWHVEVLDAVAAAVKDAVVRCKKMLVLCAVERNSRYNSPLDETGVRQQPVRGRLFKDKALGLEQPIGPRA